MVSDMADGAGVGCRERWVRCGRWAREPEERGAGSSSSLRDGMPADLLRRREVAAVTVSGTAGAGLRVRSDPRDAPARRRARASLPNTAADRSTPPGAAAAATSRVFDFTEGAG